MKLNEIKKLTEGITNQQIAKKFLAKVEEGETTFEDFMDVLGVSEDEYTLREKTFSRPEKVDIRGDVTVFESVIKPFDHRFPYRFGDIQGDFLVGKDITNGFLAEFNGPETVSGMFNINTYHGKTLEDGPHEVGQDYMVIHAPNLISLKGSPETLNSDYGISGSDKLESLDHMPKNTKGNIYIEHGPNVSLIGISDRLHSCNDQLDLAWKNVKSGGLGLLNVKGLRNLGEKIDDLFGPWEIINSHLQGKRDIFDCQQELIDAGYEEFAEL